MDLDRFKTPKRLLLIPVLMILAFIIACGGAASTSMPTSAAPVATSTIVASEAIGSPKAAPTAVSQQAVVDMGKRGGVIPMQTYAAPAHWYVWECASLSCMQNGAPLYNMLIEYNPETADGGDLRGDLATLWEVSADGRALTFHLDENARWWDGKPVTAEDVVFSLDMMTDPDEIRPRAGQLKPYYESSTAVDAYTVEVKLKFAAAAFLPYLGTDYMKIMPKHHLESGVDMKLWENQLGSGPFKLLNYERDVSYEYFRNDDYFKEGRPYWDGIKAFVISDHGTIIAALESQQVLMTNSMVSNLSNGEALELGKATVGQGTVYFGGPVGTAGLQINTKVAPFDDIRVRHALQLAIHRQPLITILSAEMDSLGGAFPPNFWFSPTDDELAQLPGFRELDGEKHPDDIAEARRLLAEAGFPDGFKTVVTARTAVEYVDIAQLLVDQLDRFLNIKASVKPMESAAGYAAYASGDWEIAAQGNGLMIMDPDAVFGGLYLKDSTRNYSHWENERLNEIYKLQTSELDQEKRRELIFEAADILQNVDNQWVGLYWSMRSWYVDDRIQNFHVSATLFNQLKHEHLWCDPAC